MTSCREKLSDHSSEIGAWVPYGGICSRVEQVPSVVRVLKQTHSATVVQRCSNDVITIPEGDGQWCRADTGLVLGIVTADCVPIILRSEDGDVAAIHAGWRGLANGVIAATVKSWSPQGKVRFLIGPAICQEHYEVGEEVVASIKEPVARLNASRKWQLCIRSQAIRQLRELGIEQGDHWPICTYNTIAFASYRAGRPGRNLSWICAGPSPL